MNPESAQETGRKAGIYPGLSAWQPFYIFTGYETILGWFGLSKYRPSIYQNISIYQKKRLGRQQPPVCCFDPLCIWPLFLARKKNNINILYQLKLFAIIKGLEQIKGQLFSSSLWRRRIDMTLRMGNESCSLYMLDFLHDHGTLE